MSDADITHTSIHPHKRKRTQPLPPHGTFPVIQRAPTLSGFDIHVFTGERLAFVSSKMETHNHELVKVTDHPIPYPLPKHQKCSACRWFEVSIFRVMENVEMIPTQGVGHRYLVNMIGRTIVQDEITFCRMEWAFSAHELLEIMTVRRPGTQERPSSVFFPKPNARALAMSCAYDTEIRDAWENRAVI